MSQIPWRHGLAQYETWDPVDSNFYINDLYLTARGFAYRHALVLDASSIPQGAVGTTIYITWTIWIETPDCDPYPMTIKPLYSPFAQKVRFGVILVHDQTGTAIWYPGTVVTTDHPTELGFSVESPPFQYSIISGRGARDGIVYPGGDTNSSDWIPMRWQSAGYDVTIPRDAKIHMGNRKYTGGAQGYPTHYTVTTNTLQTKFRVMVAKDKERRLLAAEESNGQVEIKRANKDDITPRKIELILPSPYLTTTPVKKSFPDILVDNRGNVNLFYMTKDGIESVTANDNKVGNSIVKITWPHYENVVVVGVQSREKPSGCFGQYKSMLCYRRIVGVGSKTTKSPLNTPATSSQIYVSNPERFAPGYATITDGIHKEDVNISTITYNRNAFNGKYYYRLNLSQPMQGVYSIGSLVTQERFVGLLNTFGTWSLVGTILHYPAMSVDINGCGFIPEGNVVVGTGRTYIFAVRSDNSYYIWSTMGGQKSQDIGGKIYQVDNIPVNSVLVAITENNAVDTYPGGVLIAYKSYEEFVGGTVDNTGRVSVLAHRFDGTPFAAYSENQGYNWVWSRVGD